MKGLPTPYRNVIQSDIFEFLRRIYKRRISLYFHIDSSSRKNEILNDGMFQINYLRKGQIQ